jgi:hypothetical protein
LNPDYKASIFGKKCVAYVWPNEIVFEIKQKARERIFRTSKSYIP